MEEKKKAHPALQSGMGGCGNATKTFCFNRATTSVLTRCLVLLYFYYMCGNWKSQCCGDTIQIFFAGKIGLICAVLSLFLDMMCDTI